MRHLSSEESLGILPGVTGIAPTEWRPNAVYASGVRSTFGPRALKWHLLSGTACALLAILFPCPASLHPARGLMGYSGDNFQHAWFLWHFARAISHLQNPFFTNLMYYP